MSKQFNGLECLDQTRGFLGSAIAGVFFLLAAVPVNAQQINGEPGSPSATTTINETHLPAQPPPFGGVINLNANQSKPYWPPRVVPPKGAPNVLLIMTDDAGYGISSTFGGVIQTPALERVAQMGLRYTQFHSTALCSPTRAALITGRNHHSVGFGVVTEQSTGYPGYDSIIGPENATIGKSQRLSAYRLLILGSSPEPADPESVHCKVHNNSSPDEIHRCSIEKYC
jgi:Sulfatase